MILSMEILKLYLEFLQKNISKDSKEVSAVSVDRDSEFYYFLNYERLSLST